MVFGVCVCHHSPISHKHKHTPLLYNHINGLLHLLLYSMYVAENERAAEALRALGSEFSSLMGV